MTTAEPIIFDGHNDVLSKIFNEGGVAKAASFLDRQYTVIGRVLEGMEFVDKIKRGDENNNGSVTNPDKIISFKSL